MSSGLDAILKVRRNFAFVGDIGKLNADTLIFHSILTHLWETEILLRIISWKCPALTTAEILRDAQRISSNVTGENMGALCNLYPATEPIEFLTLLQSWRASMTKELNRRVAACPVGREVVAFAAKRRLESLNESWILPLLRVLKVEKVKVKSYREHQLDTEDLLIAAVDKAIAEHQELAERVETKTVLPIPHLPDGFLGIPTESVDLWHRLDIATAQTCEQSVKFWLPLLEGRLENLPEVVRQYQRETFRKLNRRENIISNLGGQIREELHPERRAAEEFDHTLDATRAYQIAQKKWGHRGSRFVAGLSEGMSIVEASESVGVSRKTGGKYLKELRNILSKKKNKL